MQVAAAFVIGAIAVGLAVLSLGASDGREPTKRSQLSDIIAKHPFRCEQADGRCAASYLVRLTGRYGPGRALNALAVLQGNQSIATSIDDHQLAHAVGRETARKLGINGTAFERCPTTFNYGCVHGFFEYALGRVPSPAVAATTICESRRSTDVSHFSCYHGVGHGILMAEAYDLDASLDTCDTLSNFAAQEGCWQGVFMENVIAGIKNEARAGLFDVTKPLSPCTQMKRKYALQCYINHAGWLMHVTGRNLQRAAELCLRAVASMQGPCAQSLGLMVTNPSWQLSILPTSTQRSFTETAWELCRRFPLRLRQDCVVGGIDNLANFDELDLRRPTRFCVMVDAPHQAACYAQIGVNIRRRSTSGSTAADLCSAVEAPHVSECIRGTRFSPPVRRALSPARRPEALPSLASPLDISEDPAVVISMEDGSFAPSTSTIAVGETIQFRNTGQNDKWPASDPHPVHTLHAGFDAGRSIVPGGAWSFRFDVRGSWGYHDHLSPNVRGRIVVR